MKFENYINERTKPSISGDEIKKMTNGKLIKVYQDFKKKGVKSMSGQLMTALVDELKKRDLTHRM